MAITYELQIAGVVKDLQPGWSIKDTANNRGRFSFKVLSVDGSYRPALDATVTFAEKVPITSSSVAAATLITTPVPHGLHNGQLVTIAGHTGSTPALGGLYKATMINALQFTVPVNVSTGGTGGTVARRIFGGTVMFPSEAGLGGEGSAAIETQVDAADYNAIAEHRYINTKLTPVPPALSAYAFLELSANFANGNTVVLGSQTYTMQTTLTNVAGNVLIDPDTINGSLDNLAAAITLDQNITVIVSSITRVGAVATVVTAMDHNFEDQAKVVITGAIETEYNGKFTATLLTSKTFTYPVSGSPTTPATGTLLARPAIGAGTKYALATLVNAKAGAIVQGNVLKAIATTAGVPSPDIPCTWSGGSWYGEGAIPTAILRDGAASSGAVNSLKAALAELIAGGLYKDGVTLHPDQDAGPTLPQLIFDYVQLREALDQISLRADGRMWEIDEYLRLSMLAPSTRPAPIDVITGDGHAIGDITVAPSRASYANRVILRFNSAAQRAYAFMEVVSNFTDTKTVTLGNITYTFQEELTDAAGNVLIGDTQVDSINNLIAAITVGATAGVNYAAKTAKNTLVDAWQSKAGIMTAKAVEAGTAGNSIAVGSTWDDAFWYTEGSVPVATLVNGTDTVLNNTETVEDPAEQAAHGVWETVLQDITTSDRVAARVSALNALAGSIFVPKVVTYKTLSLGLRTGQTQTITAATRGVNGTYLITDVDTRGSGIVERTVTAIESDTLLAVARWRSVYTKWAGSTAGTILAAGSSGTGGSSPSSAASPIDLGGAREVSVACFTTKTPVYGYVPYYPLISAAAIMRVETKALQAGVGVTPYLYDVTDGTYQAGSKHVATAWQGQDVPVDLHGGHPVMLFIDTDSEIGTAYAIGELILG